MQPRHQVQVPHLQQIWITIITRLDCGDDGGCGDLDDGVHLQAGGLWEQDGHPAVVRMQLKPSNRPRCGYELRQLRRQCP